MKKALSQQLTIPEGVTVTLEDKTVVVTGPEGGVTKHFDFGRVEAKIEGNQLMLSCPAARKTEKKMMNTIFARMKNMIQGVQTPYEYELKVCYSHFPMTVTVSGDVATIKNFLGEKVDRHATIPQGAEIKVEKDHITIRSVDKDLAGQAAANLETATKVRNRDIRIFQDGIYITKKAGREI